MLFSTLKNLGNIEKCPFTYWLNGRWFLQIADRDSGNLYPIYPLFPCSDFVLKCGVVWGGWCNVLSHFMLFPTFLEENILRIIVRKTSFSFNVFFVFFYARSISNIFRIFFIFVGKYWKGPFTYWLNGRWFLQIVDIGNSNMKLTGMWFPQILIGTMGIYIQYM